MAESTKGGMGDKKWGQAVMDSAHQIWLAGLGAFAKAQSEGGKLFDTLVKEGEAVEGRTRKIASAQVKEMGKKASGTWDKLEQVFEDRVSRSLNRLGVPTHKEIQSLSKQVAELNGGVQRLLKSGRTPTAAAKKAARGARSSAS